MSEHLVDDADTTIQNRNGARSDVGSGSALKDDMAVNDEKIEGQEVENEEEGEKVEALSHKEMRRRRKAEKQAARGRGPEMDTTPSGPPVHPSRAAAVASANIISGVNGSTRRSKHSIWVGNLLFTTSAERLQDWFEENGIAGISRINMPKGQRRMEHNKGFAYVDVPSAEALQRCIDLSESHLDGRKLLIKSGSDYSGRPEIDRRAVELAGGATSAITAESGLGDAIEGAVHKGKTGLTKTAQKILRAQKHSPGPTLFIGNLSFNSTEIGLREMIERSASARDEWSSGRSKKKEKTKKSRKEDKSKGKNGDGSSDDESDSDSGSSAEEKAEKSDERVAKEENDGAADKGGKDDSKRAEGLRGAGIRKIRMGQFEDTGKCKGFAFIDFFSPAYATASLIDPRNARLDGRELLLQFASADAVRRGAPKGQVSGPRPNREYKREAPKRYYDDAFRGEVEPGKQDLGPAPIPGTFDPDAPVVKKHKETKEERQKRREMQGGPTRRAKPGAALANAQRGKTGIAIDAPQGIKKTFE